MENSEITDPLFRKAVEAIDSGDIILLEKILAEHPSLTRQRLELPAGGYFKNPYLLWFVADNPIRHEQLPANIVAITALIIRYAKTEDTENLQYQLDYTLGLVATGFIPHKCGVQIELMDLLIAEGAEVKDAMGALTHGNIAAAKHLLRKGAELTLPVAVCLDRKKDIVPLFQKTGDKEKQVALVAASFYGKKDAVDFLIHQGVDVNTIPDAASGFHHHATALHQAVWSGSLECVKLLVDAGADLSIKDKVYGSTPLGWSQYIQTGPEPAEKKQQYVEIENFLLSVNS